MKSKQKAPGDLDRVRLVLLTSGAVPDLEDLGKNLIGVDELPAWVFCASL